jgi:predicted nuclease with TOPRIM domain
MINDRDNKIKRLDNDNELLKNENTNVNSNINYFNSAIEAYKKHIIVLTEQNDKLSQELEAILSRDSQLMYTLGRADHLRAVVQENSNAIICSLNSLKAHIQNHENIGNKGGNNIKNSQINNITYIYKNNINNN